MKIKFDVTADEFSIIQSILSKHLKKSCKAWVFGSRAKNTARFNSDLDLALECHDKLSAKIIAQLKDDFDESKIAFKVDIVDINSVEPYFKEIIDSQKVEFPLKRNVPKLRFKPEQQPLNQPSSPLNKPLNPLKGTYNSKATPPGGRGANYPDWEEKKLGEIAKINPKISKLPKYFYYIDLESVSKGILGETHKIKIEDAPIRAQRLLQLNDILFQTVRPYQMNNFFFNKKDDDYVASTGYAQIRTTQVAKFLYQFLYSPKFLKKVILRCTGTSYPAINSSDLETISIFLPSLPEQQKIADFLTSVDDKVQQLTSKKNLLGNYKKGVMQKIFSQEIRFKPEQALNQPPDPLNKPLNPLKGTCAALPTLWGAEANYPDWEEKKLGELTQKVSEKNKDNFNYPVYSINNKNGFIPQSKQFEGVNSSDRGYDTSMYKIIHPNTFAYNPARINVGSIGYSGKLNNIIISSLYVCFQTKNSLKYSYLLHYLNTYAFKKSVLRNVEGGVRDYLFYENFSNIKIPLPHINEQQKIADFLTAIDTKIDNVSIQLEQIQSFKKGLLQQMFV